MTTNHPRHTRRVFALGAAAVLAALGLPAEDETYEFTSGLLTNGTKDVEFRVEVDILAGSYSVTPSELLELKGRAAKLFTAPPPGANYKP